MGRFSGLSGPDLKSLKIEKKEFLISPVIETHDLMLLYSSPGVGKTLLAAKLAALAASGGISMGNWKAKEPTTVFYLDTEMHLGKMRSRLEEEFLAYGLTDIPNNFKIFSQHASDHGNPNICLEQDRLELLEDFKGSHMVIIDSLSNVFRGGDDNLAFNWGDINEWLKELKKHHTVLVTHHANKAKGVRGSSKIEDPYDTIWYLGDLQHEEGKAFFAENEKNRNNLPSIGKRIGFQRSSNESGVAVWKNFSVQGNPKIEQAAMLYLQGMKQKDIAPVVGVEAPAISKYLKTARKTGLLPRKDETEDRAFYQQVEDEMKEALMQEEMEAVHEQEEGFLKAMPRSDYDDIPF